MVDSVILFRKSGETRKKTKIQKIFMRKRLEKCWVSVRTTGKRLDPFRPLGNHKQRIQEKRE
jgi:hypothetical protein